MFQIRLIAVVCLIGLSAANAQTFTKICPLPSGMNMSGVWFTSPTDGWVAGDAHSLLRTTDHGLTWTTVPIPGAATEPFYDITFATPQLGFLAGNSASAQNDMFRTTNGGATWQQMTGFPLGGSWYHIQFVSSTAGFMGSNGALVRTTDAGLTWPVRSAYPDCPIIYGMDFKDANTGLVSGYQASSNLSGIFKTTNGGQTWTLQHQGNVNHAIYLSSTTAIACDSTTIILSTDDGATWSPIGDVPTGFMSLAKVGANTIVGVSTGGDIWRSDDGGFNWTLRWPGIGDLPARWRVRFQDSLNGHVVGLGGSILETADGGITWTALNRGIGVEWHGIAAFSNSNVVFAGVHGYAQRTTDAGSHWDVQLLDAPTFGRDTLFSDIAVSGPNSAYIVGHWGSMFKTDDRGETWQNLSNSVNPSYYANGVDFIDADNGWMVGFDYNTGPKAYVRQTHDGGFSWQPATLNAPSLDVQFVGSTGYVLTTSQPLYKTIDSGETWTPLAISTPTGGPSTNMRMHWASANVGYIAGFDGFLARTTNGGATWTRVLPAQGSFVYLDVKTVGANEVWVCGASQGGGSAVVRRSLDAGANWTSFPLAGQYTDPVCIAITTNYTYVAGYAGEAWRFVRNVAGDIDGNGAVNAADTAAFVAVLLGTDTSPAHVAAADMNTDGLANGADAPPFIGALLAP